MNIIQQNDTVNNQFIFKGDIARMLVYSNINTQKQASMEYKRNKRYSCDPFWTTT